MRFYYECPKCYEEHLITSIEEVPYECANCGEWFDIQKIEQKFNDFTTAWEPDYDEDK